MDKNTKVAKLISGLAKELLVALPSKDFLDDEKFEDDDMRMDQDDDDDYNASLVSEEGKITKGGSEGRSDTPKDSLTMLTSILILMAFVGNSA